MVLSSLTTRVNGQPSMARGRGCTRPLGGGGWRSGAPSHLLISLAFLLVAGLWPGTARVQELIAHPDLPDATVTRNQARLYFSMRLLNWPTGQRVTVFVLPDDHELHSAFAKQVLGLFPYQLRGVWDRQVFSGTGQAPITVADEAEMQRRVAATPGAIGYAWSLPADAKVRVLEVR